ncbi:MAG TPA: 8-amino-7-oxononanoate synthase [Anaeromyxobacteraceae bacterium]|nr:8-amino-7-oxononanoate synthase [Anaeromyxobacteraceae bacterium]
MPKGALDWIDGALADLEAKGLRRSLETIGPAQGPVVEVGGRSLVNLCSNDYLGLAADARLRRAAAEAALREGAGSGASRLVAGDLPIHGELERAIAAFHGTEAALLFNSGYHANAGLPPALVGRGDAIFSDVLNHASIVDGAILSRADFVRYRHCDVEELSGLLARSTARRKLVVTDAVFSMDGDAAPLREIAALCERHGAMLYVDEAHAVGVLGPTGAGLAEELGVKAQVDVEMGTLGKALGSFGAYAAGERRLRDLLLTRARSFVFTTALPPAACGATLAALAIVRGEPERRARLRALCDRMRAGLTALGFDVSRVVSPIFPVVLGSEARALAAAAGLRDRGWFVRAIRPPTVPAGTSRLRVALSAALTEPQLDGFLGALAEVLSTLPPR